MELNTHRDASYSPYCSQDTHPTPNTDHDSHPIGHTPVMIRILQPTLQSLLASYRPYCSKDTHPTPNTDHDSHPIAHTPVMIRILQHTLQSQRASCSPHCSHYSHPTDHTAVMTRILQPILVMPRILQSHTHILQSSQDTQPPFGVLLTVDARHRTSTALSSLEATLGDSKPLNTVIIRAIQFPQQIITPH